MESMEGLKGKRILVTGGTGFVGSHVVELLLKKGASVIVPFRSLNPYSYFSLQKLDRKVLLVVSDLKDRLRVFDILSKYEINYVIHLAAQAIVPTAFINPAETLVNNIVGTVNILEGVRACKNITGVIIASSDKAYGKSEKICVETHRVGGDHPYEVSKSASDLIAQAYLKTYGMPIVITRFGNIYGPGDINYNRIIPGILTSFIEKKPLEIRSDGTYVRDYIYVKDVALAYVFLLKKIGSIKGQVYNISTDTTCSVLQLMKKTEKALRKKTSYRIMNTAINEIPYQHLDNSKITALGWRPSYTFKRGVRETYSWYKKNSL